MSNLRILGIGSALPSKCVTNNDLPARLETDDAWIQSRTGIRQRYICAEGETTSTLAAQAARHALERAAISASDIDLIIVATSSPDRSFPGVANLVQETLGVGKAIAFDVQAACSGFIYGLGIAEGLMKLHKAKHALIIGADTFSNLVDWEDRRTAVLFGDGAGAAVLSAVSSNGHELLGVNLSAEAHWELLYADGGVATTRTAGHTNMNGREVFKFAVNHMSAMVPEMLTEYGVNEVDYLVPHQANIRILEAVAKKLDLPMEKVVLSVGEHANTSAASIPLAIDKAQKENMFSSGDILLLSAFGAGFTWGGALVKW